MTQMVRGSKRRRAGASDRRGAVTVEFAVIAPLFVVILLGMAQATHMMETRNLLATAAREGARLAAMDREGMIPEGSTTNAKVAQDITNFLETSGVDTEDLTVEIVSHDDPTQTFDLDDPDNEFKLFEILLKLPYGGQFTGIEDFDLTAKVVFRNAQSTIME
jgi:Flp pilus assembly protein TadG